MSKAGTFIALQDATSEGVDPIRITDRFFGGQMRGFDIRGIGPRVLRTPYEVTGELSDEGTQTSDALGGRAYYMGRLELEIPTSASIRGMGIRPSAFIDVGSVWSITQPLLADIVAVCTPKTGTGPVALNTHPATTMLYQTLPVQPGIYNGPPELRKSSSAIRPSLAYRSALA